MTPFEFVNAINSTNKKDLIEDDHDLEKAYIPYLINKSFSYFPDTIMYANAMNLHNSLENKLQFHYLLNSIRPAKRFSKWVKKEEKNDLEDIKNYYGYSITKAREALNILSPTQLSTIRKQLQQGGIENEH